MIKKNPSPAFQSVTMFVNCVYDSYRGTYLSSINTLACLRLKYATCA